MDERFQDEPKDNQSLLVRAKTKARSICTYETLQQRLPIVSWLPKYRLQYFLPDFMAGLTVGITLIAQGIAYARIANLPPQYGLYSSIMGPFIYCVLGTTAEVSLGPATVLALLTADHVRKGGPTYAVLLGFLAGCIEILVALLRLDFIVCFISEPVARGFISAVAVTIGISQLKPLLGLKIPPLDVHIPSESLKTVYGILTNLPTISLYDSLLGVGCIIILLLLKRLPGLKSSSTASNSSRAVLINIAWFIGIARNALVLSLVSTAAYVLVMYDTHTFTLTGYVPSGLPSFSAPNFTAEIGNSTKSFLDIVSDFGPTIVIMPLFAFLEMIPIIKIFNMGKSVDITQDVFALGVSNIMTSFVSGFHGTAAISRSAINASCGVKTPLSGLIAGTLVLISIGVLSSSFAFIPQSALAAVVITAVLNMVECRLFLKLWRSKKMDFVVMVVTFGACLIVGPEYGIMLGLGVSLAVLLAKNTRPMIVVKQVNDPDSGKTYIVVQPQRDLFFPAVDKLRSKLLGVRKKNDNAIPVVFDGKFVPDIDFTTAECIIEAIEEFHAANQTLTFKNLKSNVFQVLSSFKCKHFQSEEHQPVFVTTPNVGLLTNHHNGEDLELRDIPTEETVHL